MKKKIITHLITFIIGGLIFGSIGTVLALTYKASDIVYTPSDTSWNVTTVGEAINSLALSKTSDNYSTEEQVVGTWIDGKPIYQKTIRKDNVGAGDTTIALNNILIDHMINMFSNHNGNVQNVMGQYVDENYAITAWYNKSSDLLYIRNKSDNRNITVYITIQYTKTTDSAAN